MTKIDIDISYGQGDLDERYLDNENEEVYNFSETFEDIDDAIKFLEDIKSFLLFKRRFGRRKMREREMEARGRKEPPEELSPEELSTEEEMPY